MNLELLDPFRRQIPDRVDATLALPDDLHFRKKRKDKKQTDADDLKAANHVAFNRRGAYIAVGYGSGTVGIFDVLSRTLSGLYRSNEGEGEDGTSDVTTTGHGITSLSWSRRSRTLVAGSAGDAEVRIIDTTHPFGPGECCVGVTMEETKKDKGDEDPRQSPTQESNVKKQSNQSSFIIEKPFGDHHKRSRELKVKILETRKDLEDQSGRKRERQSHIPVANATVKRYPSIVFHLPLPIGSFLHAHPRDTSAGLAALNDGSLVAYWVPRSSWEENAMGESDPVVKVATIFKSESHFVTFASIDPHGSKVYAGTKEGKILGFDISVVFDYLAADATEIPELKPNFTISIPGGAMIWNMVVSRNCQNLVVNSADGVIRLYTTKECWNTPEEVDKPTMAFQDVVSKVKFVSCDISGDSEFLVGGANGDDNKYELYIWNTSTGALMDKLTGATVGLFSVSWHPTRSFLSVATSDGLVDIWGPRINWTAFAPDFQALPQNVEYVECEDEFDTLEASSEADKKKEAEEEDEDTDVDVLTVEPVPVFASDSEDEGDVFAFETKVTRLLGGIAS
jgi:WD40 repeat protein